MSAKSYNSFYADFLRDPDAARDIAAKKVLEVCWIRMVKKDKDGVVRYGEEIEAREAAMTRSISGSESFWRKEIYVGEGKTPITKGFDLVITEWPYSTYWVQQAKFGKKKEKDADIPLYSQEVEHVLKTIVEVQKLLNRILEPGQSIISSPDQLELMKKAIAEMTAIVRYCKNKGEMTKADADMLLNYLKEPIQKTDTRVDNVTIDTELRLKIEFVLMNVTELVREKQKTVEKEYKQDRYRALTRYIDAECDVDPYQTASGTLVAGISDPYAGFDLQGRKKRNVKANLEYLYGCCPNFQEYFQTLYFSDIIQKLIAWTEQGTLKIDYVFFLTKQVKESCRTMMMYAVRQALAGPRIAQGDVEVNKKKGIKDPWTDVPVVDYVKRIYTSLIQAAHKQEVTDYEKSRELEPKKKTIVQVKKDDDGSIRFVGQQKRAGHDEDSLDDIIEEKYDLEDKMHSHSLRIQKEFDDTLHGENRFMPELNVDVPISVAAIQTVSTDGTTRVLGTALPVSPFHLITPKTILPSFLDNAQVSFAGSDGSHALEEVVTHTKEDLALCRLKESVSDIRYPVFLTRIPRSKKKFLNDLPFSVMEFPVLGDDKPYFPEYDIQKFRLEYDENDFVPVIRINEEQKKLQQGSFLLTMHKGMVYCIGMLCASSRKKGFVSFLSADVLTGFITQQKFINVTICDFDALFPNE